MAVEINFYNFIIYFIDFLWQFLKNVLQKQKQGLEKHVGKEKLYLNL